MAWHFDENIESIEVDADTLNITGDFIPPVDVLFTDMADIEELVIVVKET